MSDDAKKAPKKDDARTPAQIRADIAATRVELEETVDALSARLDVKTRAQGEIARIKAYVADPANRPQVVAAAVAVVAVVALRVTKPRRKARKQTKKNAKSRKKSS